MCSWPTQIYILNKTPVLLKPDSTIHQIGSYPNFIKLASISVFLTSFKKVEKIPIQGIALSSLHTTGLNLPYLCSDQDAQWHYMDFEPCSHMVRALCVFLIPVFQSRHLDILRNLSDPKRYARKCWFFVGQNIRCLYNFAYRVQVEKNRRRGGGRKIYGN